MNTRIRIGAPIALAVVAALGLVGTLSVRVAEIPTDPPRSIAAAPGTGAPATAVPQDPAAARLPSTALPVTATSSSPATLFASDVAPDGAVAAAAQEAPEGSPQRPAALAVRGERFDRAHPGMARAIEVQERHLELLANPAVIGTAVGLKGADEPAIVVYTRVDGADLPASLEGVPVVVKRRSEFRAWLQQAPARTRDDVKARAGETSNAQRWERPVPIGVSTGHPQITAGTIGCRVRNGAGQVFALSNNHVLANTNAASIGDAALQPGPYDGGVPSDQFATLYDFQPIKFGGPPHRPTNEMDAAVALTTTADLGRGTPSTGGYGTPTETPVSAAVGLAVRKVGRTTGYTTGAVDAINASVGVSYGTGVAYFRRQIVVTPGAFSQGGDSGSLIVDASNHPVGLLFAGSEADTIANEIQRVLSRFGVTVDGAPPNQAPSVALAVSETSVDAGEPVLMTATASDADGSVAQVDFYANGVLLGSDPSSPYEFSWGNAPEGTHTLTARATDDDGATTTSSSVSVTVGTPTSPPENVVKVGSILYATAGSRGRDLLITVGLDPALGGASVSIRVSHEGGSTASGTSSTGSDGRVTFKWRNAPSGTYTTLVTAVSAAGYDWDGVTPPNSFTKP
ncbi:MAG TPA: Ig-like domain-containing protein [Planctomycetota bacterium]|nr:Ig-like domain-containing protein [Planctomycetota bacterium]